MSEYNIATNADVLVMNRNRTSPWICRDDNGHFWTIFQNTSQNIEIYHSEDSGATWTLKKTLTAGDFTSLTMPVDNFNIAHCVGQNKVYVLLMKPSTGKYWGWLINTSTDTGSVDVNNASHGAWALIGPHSLRWDSLNNKLYAFQSAYNQYNWYTQYIPMNGTLSTTQLYSGVSGEFPTSGAIDTSGNFFMSVVGYESLSYHPRIYKNTNYLQSATTIIAPFALTLADYAGRGILLAYRYQASNAYIYAYRAKADFSAFDVDGTFLVAASGDEITSFTGCVDGLNNVYVIYTLASNSEAYYAKFDGTAKVWGTPTLLSSGNDGVAVSSEVRGLLASNTILVTYQATA